jgi:hypothetical protein
VPSEEKVFECVIGWIHHDLETRYVSYRYTITLPSEERVFECVITWIPVHHDVETR